MMDILSALPAQTGQFAWRLREAAQAALLIVAILAGAASSADGQVQDAITARIWARVQAQPNDAVSWRLLAKVLRQQGDLAGARNALERATSLDPENAAAQHDLGLLLLESGQNDAAVDRFKQAVQLAPDSEQGQAAQRELERLGVADASRVQLANFVPRWVEPPPPVEEVIEPPSYPLTLRIEAGALYNSNVALAPISRGLSPLEDGGFQTFLAPQGQYRFDVNEMLEAGVLFDSYFTVNQDDVSEFDLEHYEPGVYLATVACWGETVLTPRLDYEYAYDAFGNNPLGTRHTVTTSVSLAPPGGNLSFIYWAIDYANFDNDGDDPEFTSLDGWTHTLGVSQAWASPWAFASRLHASLEAQAALLQGDDYAYYGLMGYCSADIPLGECWELRPEFGLGGRVYPDFSLSPSRDEIIFRAGGELRRWLNEHWRLSGTFYYDNFLSENDDFSAERLTAGIVLGFEL